MVILTRLLFRYQIDDNDDAWKDAEKAVISATKGGKSNPVVSVKSSKQKRKAGPTAEDVYNEVFGEKDKKHRKSKKSKK